MLPDEVSKIASPVSPQLRSPTTILVA